MTTPANGLHQADHAPDGKIRLRAGWLIDGRGGPLRKDMLVELRHDRIAAIRPFYPGDAEAETVVDLSHATLLPPLMDAHVHLSFSGKDNPQQGGGWDGQSPEQVMALIALHLREHWRSGIAAVRDAGDSQGSGLQFKNGRFRDWPFPQTIKAPGWAWHAPARYGRMLGRILSEDQPIDPILSQSRSGPDHIKLINSGINSLDDFGRQTAPQFNPSFLKKIRAFAGNRHLPVMVHANGAAPVAAALEAGCDSIEHGYFMGEQNLQHMADQQTYWVPTVVPMAALAQDKQLTQKQRDVARRTRDDQLKQIYQGHRMGVPIVLGTDAGSPGVAHGQGVWQEIQWLQKAGLSLEAVVCCATSNASSLLRLESRGILAKGDPADFLVVTTDLQKGINADIEPTAVCMHGVWWRGGQPDSRCLLNMQKSKDGFDA